MTTYENDAPVHIVPYDTTWPDLFERERRILAEALSAWLVGPIQHVGSTAVPGLAAKPVIDIMAPVLELDSSRPALTTLADFEYLYSPYRDDVMHWFCKPSFAFRTHHLHLVPFNSQLWFDRLTFRDFLRGNPRVAAEYADLKHKLAGQHRFDREAYTDAKRPFVRHVLDLAARKALGGL
jgi:GrpB-like predicted nucleotidyltransferase (UPF0157 family)